MFNEVIQVFRLVQRDVQAGICSQTAHGRSIGAALVEGDRLGHIVQSDRSLEESSDGSTVAFGREQEVHGVAE
jgi:hypothetical protein